MMKIMFAIGQLSNGGAERVVSLLANSLSNNNDVCIVMLIKNEIVYDITETVEVKYCEANSNNRLLRIINRLHGLNKYISQWKPDCIVSFTTEINIYSLFSKHRHIPIIISERNDPYNDPPSYLTRRIRDKVYRKANYFVFQTEDAKKYFDSIIVGKAVVIPNPVSDNLLDARYITKKKKIVTVSRLYKQKNIGMLINAFAKIVQTHPEYSLEVYGDGPLKEELEDMCESLKVSDKVHFEGFCKDVHDRISNAELFVLSSDYEGMSNAMLEAIAMGIPTICTDCPIGGARMVIRNYQNGILVPVNDVNVLADEMTGLIENPNLQHSISENGFKLRYEMSTEKIVNKWQDFILQVYMDQG